MTASMSDNNHTVDNLTFITFDDHSYRSESDGDEDFFFCRKCNKIFKNLPEYLEHKIKYENFRLVQTHSNLDRRIILPKLVPKNVTPKGNVSSEKEEKTSAAQSSLAVEITNNKKQLSAQQSSIEQSTDMVVTQSEVLVTPKKRGRKKKMPTNEKPEVAVSQSLDMYACKICGSKFRREATLRWHMSYEHKSKAKKGEDSEGSDEDRYDDEKDSEYKVDDKGNEYTVRAERNENSDGYKAADEKGNDNGEEKTVESKEMDVGGYDKVTECSLECSVKENDRTGVETNKEQTEASLCLIIEQPVPENLEAQSLENDTTTKKFEGATRKGKRKCKKVPDRPFTCDICGRSFKEANVLKSHTVVHSDERHYICTFENCPYGFKTKGGLVRHERRHTGERPFVCEKCNRAFSESGALTRHMKARRDCSDTPDSAYPRYRKSWTYHPNIPAVLDPNLRDSQKGRSTLPHFGGSLDGSEEVHFIITDISDEKVISGGLIAPKLESILPHIVTAEMLTSEGGEIDSKLEIKLEAEGLEEWVSAKEILDKSDEVSAMKNPIVVSADVEYETAALTHEEQSRIETVESSEISSAVEVVMEVDPDLMELKSVIDVEQLKVTQCHVCRKDLETAEGLELHLRSHLADQPTRCGLCHFLSNDREELRQHILSMHYDSLNDIEASVLSMEEDSTLTKLETMDRKVVLRNALTAVKQLYSLKKNKPVPEVEKPGLSATGTLQCMVCSRLFRGNSYLRQHMRSHTGDRPYRCNQCDRSFTTRDILKKHMYVHKEQRDFKCGECGKLFKSLSHVRQHIRIHMQERSFRCSICDKLFKTQNTLKVHLRTHSGVNPYKCQICGHCFRERGSLQRHMRLHTGEKPYKCHKCNRAFAEQGTLIRHHKAKIPCTVNQDSESSTGNSNATMLAQFSSVVADTQYILPEVDPGQQYVLPADQEMTENYVILQTTGEESEVVDNFEIITEERVTTADLINYGEEPNQDTETLEIFDPTTGESVIIVAEKSIVDLVREQQRNIESEDGSSSMQKIKDILIAAGKGGDIITTFKQELTSSSSQETIDQVVECEKTDLVIEEKSNSTNSEYSRLT